MSKFLRYLAAALLALAIPIISKNNPDELSLHGGHLTCIIDLGGYRSANMSYSTGYNYELLGYFAREHDCAMEVILAEHGDSHTDYLAIDSVDILICPYVDSAAFFPSRKLYDGTTWKASDESMQRALNKWLTLFSFSEVYPDIKERFSPSYEPFARSTSGRSYKYAGPYDALVKKYAALLQWDWRLLEAIVWQESKFHIEARSRRGAVGLMQMMPSTASRYGVDDMLDPEENLRAAVEYLAKLQRMFAPFASPEELPRFTLAAYNAGEGRILDCIRYARAKGMPCESWNDIEAVIPLMREASPTDTLLRLGPFKGYETISYIHRTDSLYAAFRAIAP